MSPHTDYISDAGTSQFTKKSLPGWLEKVIVWFIIGILTMFTTVAVNGVKVEALDKRLTQHEVQQLNHESEDIRDKEEFRKSTVTHDQFDQFEKDLNTRLDRLQNTVEKKH